MADINSSLPVRTESAGDLDINISDATTPSQKLKVNADGSVDTNFATGAAVEITDGTDTMAVEADGSINVNAAFAAGTKVRLTDGVEDSQINASGELQVRDDDANTLLGTIDADTSNLDVALSTVATQATLSALNAKFVSGTDIGDVTINNAGAGAAVNIQDGGNSITVDASALDIRTLSDATDSVAIGDGVETVNVNASNELQVRDDDANTLLGTIDADTSNLDVALSTVATQATLAAMNTKFVSGTDIGDVTINNTSGAGAVNIQDGGNSITVDASALDIRALSDATDSVSIGDGTDTMAVNTDGSINVKVSDRSGVEQDDYDTAAAVASSATDNHDYTTTGAFRLTQVQATASSRIKAEIQVETAAASGVFNTLAVLFTTEDNLNGLYELKSPKLVTSGAIVRVIRTNRDNQAQDLYSTITGFNE